MMMDKSPSLAPTAEEGDYNSWNIIHKLAIIITATTVSGEDLTDFGTFCKAMVVIGTPYIVVYPSTYYLVYFNFRAINT